MNFGWAMNVAHRFFNQMSANRSFDEAINSCPALISEFQSESSQAQWTYLVCLGAKIKRGEIIKAGMKGQDESSRAKNMFVRAGLTGPAVTNILEETGESTWAWLFLQGQPRPTRFS